MRLALLTDIHGNVEALDACLAAIAVVGVDGFVVLGDLVGYGPDPKAVVDRVRGLAATGAVVLKGNHDAAIARGPEGMTDAAASAIRWTRDRLDQPDVDFLASLPMTERRGDRLYVHASADTPAAWNYVDGRAAAAASLKATDARLTFCGHTHVPVLFHQIGAQPVQQFTPVAGQKIPYSPARRYLCVIGAVGQPRDRNPNACWALLEDDGVTYHRVPYDIDAVIAKINAAGLPEWLGRRLKRGQ